MKIGIFDSGLGGLVITKAVINRLPQYDYVYLGDTKRVPYGNRSPETVYEFAKAAVNFLFQQDCLLVILACNTASALALRKIQQEFMPKNYPGRRILGVIIPTVEALGEQSRKVGILGTAGTVKAKIYNSEINKIYPNTKVISQAAPLLVPLIENNGLKWAGGILESYLEPLKKAGVDNIILGCTHYPILKTKIKKLAGKKIKINSQDEIVPEKLADYLRRHAEIAEKLSRRKRRLFLVTDKNTNFNEVAGQLFGKKIKFKLVNYKV
ncbi:MAG: glutamate racemase [Patescibacteria group bacterium]|nr:glutamate racemase [Patescibacteria group bacterium]